MRGFHIVLRLLTPLQGTTSDVDGISKGGVPLL